MSQYDARLSVLRADLRSMHRRRQRLLFAVMLFALVVICAVLAR
jgi:hypothetical protein